LERPIGIYASSLSRRDLARRRARMRPFSERAGNWAAITALLVLAAAVAERLLV
jgi:hypothetical protein